MSASTTTSSASNALELLRETIRRKGKLGEEGEFIIFSDGQGKPTSKLAKSTETAYMVRGRQVEGKQEYYTLHELVFFYNHKDTGVGSYMKAAKTANLRFVPFAQKKSLEAYLSCAVDTSDDVDSAKIAQEERGKKDAEGAALGKRKSSGIAAKDAEKAAKEAAPMNQRDKNMRLWKKREQPSSTIDSVMECGLKLQKELEAIRTQVREIQKKRESQQQAAVAKKHIGMPIIIVPAASTSAITIYNIKDFLEKGKFVHSAVAKEQKNVSGSEIVISRINPATRQQEQYKVVNAVNKFASRHWDRVVAVFAHGPEWQFKGWKWKTPAQIFSNSAGLHVYFDDVKVAPSIKNWNVKVFPLKKQQRNLDNIQAHRIWQEIDYFIRNNKAFFLDQ